MNKKQLKEVAKHLGKLRWKGRTDEEKSAHGKMMANRKKMKREAQERIKENFISNIETK